MKEQVYLHCAADYFTSYLDKLEAEIRAYEREEDMWLLEGSIANSAGNLALHLLGNLQHFIGARLGKSGYIRKRELEFSMTSMPREKILEELVACRKMIAEILYADAPEYADCLPEISDRAGPEEKSLIHLLMHLAYHIGQINYHRRILTGKTE